MKALDINVTKKHAIKLCISTALSLLIDLGGEGNVAPGDRDLGSAPKRLLLDGAFE
jgi:hypothetical protein